MQQLLFSIDVNSSWPISAKSAKSAVVQFSQNNTLGEEAYTLSINSSKISIQAKTGKGAFYALQTLLQLMPAQVYAGTKMQETLSIPKGASEDYNKEKFSKPRRTEHFTDDL